MKAQPVTLEQKKRVENNNVALVGRQSIYDSALNIFAHEVLYRASETIAFASPKLDGNKAISNAMVSTFLDVGLETIVGQKRAFINVMEEFIDGSVDVPWSSDLIVIEISGDVNPTLKVMQDLQALKFKGYSIALDSFTFIKEKMPLVPLADIVKIDLTKVDRVELEVNLRALKKISDVKLLAMKIETQEEFQFCKAVGFNYFQGCFLEKPVIIKGSRIAPNKIATLQIVNRLQAPTVEIEELDDLIKIDVSLSHKILKYINSSGFHLGGEVTSINQALMLLGIKKLKNWASLIVLSGLSDKPLDITQKTLIRAKMCELIAEVIKQKNKDDYFLVGMFSLLDVMLSQKMKHVLSTIYLRQELKEALLHYKHKEGKVLRLVVAYEQGAWEDMRPGTITAKSLRSAYLSSVSWAEDAMSGLAVS